MSSAEAAGSGTVTFSTVVETSVGMPLTGLSAVSAIDRTPKRTRSGFDAPPSTDGAASTSRSEIRTVPIIGTSVRRASGLELVDGLVGERPQPLGRGREGEAGETDPPDFPAAVPVRERHVLQAELRERTARRSRVAHPADRHNDARTRPVVAHLQAGELDGAHGDRLVEIGEHAELLQSGRGRGLPSVAGKVEGVRQRVPAVARRAGEEIAARSAGHLEHRARGVADGEVLHRETAVHAPERARPVARPIGVERDHGRQVEVVDGQTPERAGHIPLRPTRRPQLATVARNFGDPARLHAGRDHVAVGRRLELRPDLLIEGDAGNDDALGREPGETGRPGLGAPGVEEPGQVVTRKARADELDSRQPVGGRGTLEGDVLQGHGPARPRESRARSGRPPT